MARWGYRRDVEFGSALSGDLLHPMLDGFGPLLNASYIESSIGPDGLGQGNGTDTFPGLDFTESSKLSGLLLLFQANNLDNGPFRT